MNKNKSGRSKRRKIQEQLSAYTSDYPIISTNVIETDDVDNFSHESLTNNEVLSEVSNNSFICSITSPLEISITNKPQIEIRSSNQIPKEILNTPQIDTNENVGNCSSSDMCSMLSTWTLNYNIPHNALNGLLSVLRSHSCFSNIPLDARTILHTKSINKTNIRDIDSGQYYHFGLKKEIEHNFQHDVNKIELVIGIDGLPIFKSTSSQFWPILAYMRPHNNIVFPIGIFHGTQKPSSCNDFLRDFVIEAKYLISNGITINSKFYEICIDVICCDAPAKSFVLMVKGHTGYFSCTRCKVEGEFKENRTCFPYDQLAIMTPSRTHNEYIERIDKDYHISSDISCITEIPNLDVVSNFSLDYMHLICLGTVKKLILLWKKGPYNVRLPSWKIDCMSNDALNLKPSFPCEFSRKPRSLDEISRFKATELRTYLLYIFPIILKKNLSDDCFKQFMSLNIAMMVLLSPDHSSFVSYARDLLKYFVHSFKDIYGSHLISHNIHGLLHIADDYERYGPLDNCSSFPFENYMQTLKKYIRKPDKPLEQVVLRYQERENLTTNNKSSQIDDFTLLGPHNKGPLITNSTNPQFTKLIVNNFKFKSKINADAYCCSHYNEIVKLINIAHCTITGKVVLIGKKFESMQDLYDQPIKSSHFGIYLVHSLSNNLLIWSVSDIKKKVMLFSFENKLIAVPFLHSL